MAEDKQELPAEVTAEPRVVEAVFTSSNTGELAQGPKSVLAKLIEQAMSDAVTQALKDGVSINDDDAIRERVLAARQAAKEWYSKKVLEAQAELLAREKSVG